MTDLPPQSSRKQRITIRQAGRDDLDWINQRYDQVGFKHSHLERELVAIAEVSGQPAGLGRIQLAPGSTVR